MGFFGKLFETVGKSFGKLLDLGKEVAEEAIERIGKVIEAVEKGDWPQVFREVTDTVGAVLEKVREFSDQVVDALEKVTGVAFDGVEQVIATVTEVGNLLLEQFKAHPEECIRILTSLVGAAAALATGNIPGAAAMLASGFVQVYRLRDVVRAERPDIDVEKEYPLPEQVKTLAEEAKEIPDDQLDEHFTDRAKNLNLAGA
jgi:hypothetical protein